MAARFRIFTILALALLLGLVAAAYWPGLSGGYVLDDFVNILDPDNLKLQSLSTAELVSAAFSGSAGPLGRPVAVLSFALERYFFGLNPWVMKFDNLLIHLVNTILIYLLATKLLLGGKGGRQPLSGPEFIIPVHWIALTVAAAWALTPINLTGVLYVVQRMESLAALFMLLGVLGYIHGRNRLACGRRLSGGAWIWGAFLLAGGLGVLSKETAAVLPLFLLAVEFALFGFGARGTVERRDVVAFYALILVLPGMLVLWWKLPGVLSGSAFSNREFTLSERLWTEARVVWHYIAWTLVPNPASLTLYHDAFPVSRGPLSPWTSLLSVAAFSGLAALVWFARHRFPWFSFGVAWFFIPHLLVSTVLSLELVYEHRNYLASFGLFLALFSLIFRRWTVREELVLLAKVFAAVLIGAYAALTALRALEWGDPVRLAYFEAARQPDSPRAQYELGRLLTAMHQPSDPAFGVGVDAMKTAAAIPTSGLLPIQGILVQYHKTVDGRSAIWWDRLRSYVVHRPLSSADINGLYALSRRAIEAVDDPYWDPLDGVLSAALSANPRNATLLQLYANFALNRLQNPEQALALLHRAQVLRPTQPRVWENTVELWLILGRYEYAARALRRLESLNRFGQLDAQIAKFRGRLSHLRRSDAVSVEDAERSRMTGGISGMVQNEQRADQDGERRGD